MHACMVFICIKCHIQCVWIPGFGATLGLQWIGFGVGQNPLFRILVVLKLWSLNQAALCPFRYKQWEHTSIVHLNSEAGGAEIVKRKPILSSWKIMQYVMCDFSLKLHISTFTLSYANFKFLNLSIYDILIGCSPQFLYLLAKQLRHCVSFRVYSVCMILERKKNVN